MIVFVVIQEQTLEHGGVYSCDIRFNKCVFLVIGHTNNPQYKGYIGAYADCLILDGSYGFSQKRIPGQILELGYNSVVALAATRIL